MTLKRRKKKDERSIVSILILGLVVLSISVVVCFAHVWDVQKFFEKEVTEQTYAEIKNLSAITQETVEQNLDVMKHVTRVWETVERTQYEDGIFEFIKKYNELDDFDQIFYVVYQTGKVYGDGKMLKIMSQKELSTYGIKVKEPTVGISDNGFGKGKEEVIYYIMPVHQNNAVVGCLIGVHSAEHLLDSVVYGSAQDNGDLFLINSDGQIFTQKAHIFPDMTENEENAAVPNFFNRMMKHAVDSYSKTAVRQLKTKLKRVDYIKTSIVDDLGMTDYIEVRTIKNVEDIYLVYLYPESVYTETVQPVVFKSLLVSMVIVLLTIGMLMFVWGKNKRANEMISSLAYDDVITGGKNDNYFRDVASKVIWENDSIPYIVVRFDIVNFRYINEAYGHVRADELLRVVGQETAKVFYNKEICTRMTADQFVLLAKNDPDFEQKCESLIATLNEKARIIGIKFPIRLKRGIYQVRKEDTDIGVIIDRANAARKTLTGDEKVLTMVYSDKIIDQMYRVDQIESEMDAAMRNGEFKVFIQPKWDITHDRIYGGEALVRWIKDDGGMVFPDEFIPVFEKNGFIEKLDMYMLEEVCKRLRMLIDEGRTIYPISVNQSRILMHNPEYISQVAKILRRYRIPNGYIELEVTETVFLDERSSMISIMNQLKEMEIQLSMDDFGSGYSSLNMLKDIPFDVMKIDREFFSESATSNSSVLILSKIIEMAEGLGIRVLCEGVETAEQVELLKELGCHYVQGYFYSKPMPVKDYCDTYCHEMENAKIFYDGLFTREALAREERSKQKAEAKHAQSAVSAVESFKKTYVAKEENRKDKKEEDGKKRLSIEEQKALAQMEREAKKAKALKEKEDKELKEKKEKILKEEGTEKNSESKLSETAGEDTE